ncbi:hypothetical protein RP20_CCG012071 [Aedes albopictus]|nr:hypothetical protein RP20_CCG012071 [Aedes albopictus]
MRSIEDVPTAGRTWISRGFVQRRLSGNYRRIIQHHTQSSDVVVGVVHLEENATGREEGPQDISPPGRHRVIRNKKDVSQNGCQSDTARLLLASVVGRSLSIDRKFREWYNERYRKMLSTSEDAGFYSHNRDLQILNVPHVAAAAASATAHRHQQRATQAQASQPAASVKVDMWKKARKKTQRTKCILRYLHCHVGGHSRLPARGAAGRSPPPPRNEPWARFRSAALRGPGLALLSKYVCIRLGALALVGICMWCRCHQRSSSSSGSQVGSYQQPANE